MWNVPINIHVPLRLKLVAFSMTVALLAEAEMAELEYAIKWNGENIEPVELTVSACPMNMSWSGYQRPKSQTKKAYAINVDLENGKGKLELKLTDAMKKVMRTRPLDRGFDFEFTKPERFVLEFPGVAPDLHVFVNEEFKYEHVANERYFAAGEHDAGLIRPQDGETIVFAPGAHVYGAIMVDHKKDVKIIGRGVLDSSRMVRKSSDGGVLKQNGGKIRRGEAPYDVDGMQFTAYGSTNLLVDGVMMIDPPFWGVTLAEECHGTVFDNVKLVGYWRYNSDGIDVCDAADTVIRNSFIRSFDDCVVARGWSSFGTRDLVVEDCELWCDWGKNCEVWLCSTPCTVENVQFRRLKILNSDYAVFDVTDWVGADGIYVKNVGFEDIDIDLVAPRYSQYYQNPKTPDQSFVPVVRNDFKLAQINYWDAGTWKTDADRERAMKYRIEFDDIRMSGVRLHGEKPSVVDVVINDNPGPLKITNLQRENPM